MGCKTFVEGDCLSEQEFGSIIMEALEVGVGELLLSPLSVLCHGSGSCPVSSLVRTRCQAFPHPEGVGTSCLEGEAFLIGSLSEDEIFHA